jgi:hypothetical protein
VTRHGAAACGEQGSLGFSVVATAFCAAFAAVAPPAQAAGCEPSQGLHFVCGTLKPEDLAHIPGTRWLITSGFSDGAGLKLIDTNALTVRTWNPASAAQIRKGGGLFNGCPAPPDPK